MRWLCGLCASLACLPAVALGAGPTTHPTSRPADLVPLQVELPARGYDGSWNSFQTWRRKCPEAEICVGEIERFLVPRGTRNLALHKPVTSGSELIFGELKWITDGDKGSDDGSRVEVGPDLQWVQIDLGRPCALYAILIWHGAGFPSLHHDVIVQLSDDPRFEHGVRTIFNNDRDNSSKMGRGTDREYFEAVGTKVIDAKGIAARYVRLYSNGGIRGPDLNEYVEVEIHGLPNAGDAGAGRTQGR